MGGCQIEHSYSKVGQYVGSIKSVCVCVCVFVCKRVMQLFLFPCYKMFAFHTYSSHPESVGEFLFVCVCVYLCYQIHTVDASWCVCVSLSVSGSKSVYATLSLISLAMALAWLWSDRALEW